MTQNYKKGVNPLFLMKFENSIIFIQRGIPKRTGQLQFRKPVPPDILVTIPKLKKIKAKFSVTEQCKNYKKIYIKRKAKIIGFSKAYKNNVAFARIYIQCK